MKPVMTCAEVEELLGAYALGALPEADRIRVEEHLQTCSEHREAAEELRQVTPLLALTVEEREVSPELRRRIADAVSREPQRPTVQASEARPQPSVQGTRQRWRLPTRRAALAVAAVILLAVGAAIGHLATQPSTQVVAYTFAGTALAPQAHARIVYFTDQQQALVDVSGLPAITPGQVYEMWLFKGNHPSPAGVAATSGSLVARIDANLAEYQQFAITVEPGEQPQPTTTPILVGRLG